MKLHEALARGFDLSEPSDAYVQIRCSQCASCVVNGVPLHEHGCPNATRECHGCSARVPVRRKYCDDCVRCDA